MVLRLDGVVKLKLLVLLRRNKIRNLFDVLEKFIMLKNITWISINDRNKKKTNLVFIKEDSL